MCWRQESPAHEESFYRSCMLRRHSQNLTKTDKNSIIYPGLVGRPRLPEPRKVRTPKSMAPGNSRGGETCRNGPQRTTAARYWLAVRVKRWCKRPPAQAAMAAARQPPPGARPSREKYVEALFKRRTSEGCSSSNPVRRIIIPGRLLELCGDAQTR